ncbi:EamA family transporter [Paenibacillus radicis (ex Xue et al. 2023)]|uniref:EamA family transporter n=1 Tax=Paenibacillus radicis (ex Xue et al. 2023) TaxID=2972489 RepID=A0ABT1YUK9_9BACL|nr:EamA family transporter [Paenibacillus radicis (ex Xue et al. 2023)]MCR8635985.1 EamA family transporter [Paenibacillus radicis (ex Xue et al. 2023)]
MIIKWKVNQYGSLPVDFLEKIYFLIKIVFDPFILSGLFSAFISSFFWMAAMTKFDISYAYPFMILSFVLVFILSIFIFNEPVTAYKIIGLLLIVLGVIVTSRST